MSKNLINKVSFTLHFYNYLVAVAIGVPSGVAPGGKPAFKSILKTSKYKAFDSGTYVSIICY